MITSTCATSRCPPPRRSRAISDAIAKGQITPSEGAALSSMISGFSRTIDIWELSRRIEAIEASLNPKDEK